MWKSICPLARPEFIKGGVTVWLHTFLTLAHDSGKSSASGSLCFCPGGESLESLVGIAACSWKEGSEISSEIFPLFWDVIQRIVVIPYRRFGKIFWFHRQGSRIQERMKHITCTSHHVVFLHVGGRTVALIFFTDMRVVGRYLVSSFTGRDCRTDRCMLLVKFGADFR